MNISGNECLKKVVVLNPKGGSGKTTLAFNIAGYLASTGRAVALLDMDSQGSSNRWLHNRSAKQPTIQALSAPAEPAGKITVPADIDVVVIDAPAALSVEELADYTCGMHAILVPVLPSDIDIHAASRLVSDLLLKAQVSRRNGRLGIVANRIKERTIAYRKLMRFLESLSIKLIGVLRDSQNYTHAAAEGRCLHEMTASKVSKDIEQWTAITSWLEVRLATPLTPRDWLRPAKSHHQKRRLPAMILPAAAALGAIAIGSWFLAATNVTPVGDRPELAEPPAAAEVDEPGTRWRLTGIVQNGNARVLVLRDQHTDTTVNLNIDSEIDGWSVADSGSDYAVLRQDGREILLALNDENTR